MLFLHGYLSCKESFSYQIKYFSRFFRVVAVDMTGFGNSPMMKKPYSLDDYAAEISSVIDTLNVKKVDIIAHSFGARVLVRLLKTDDRIDKIVLTGAAGLKPRRTVKYVLNKLKFNALSHFIPREKLKKYYSEDYNSLNDVMKESFKLIIGDRLDEEYKKIKNETLLVFGKDDRETPLYAAKRMRKYIKNSKLKVLPHAGHFCFCEFPDEFNGVVFSFLTGGL